MLCAIPRAIWKFFVTESSTALLWDERGNQWIAYADCSTYTTMLSDEQTHSRALTAVAKTGRLTLAQAMEPEYLKLAMEHWRPHEILLSQRQQNQAFMVLMIQKLFNISIQASLVGISANLSVVNENGAGADPLTVASVLVSCFLGFGAVVSQFLSSTSMCNKVLAGVDKKLQVEGATKWQIHHECAVARTARKGWWFTVMFLAVCLVALMWCTLKTVMAWVCECGTWNLRLPVFHPSSWLDFWQDSSSWHNQERMGCVRFHYGSNTTGCSVPHDQMGEYVHPDINSFINISDRFDCRWLLQSQK